MPDRMGIIDQYVGASAQREALDAEHGGQDRRGRRDGCSLNSLYCISPFARLRPHRAGTPRAGVMVERVNGMFPEFPFPERPLLGPETGLGNIRT